MNTFMRYFYALLFIAFWSIIIISYEIGRYYAVEPCNNNFCPVKLEAPRISKPIVEPIIEPIVEPGNPEIYSILVPNPESFKPAKKTIPTGILNEMYNL
jgi:hypothetical protein